MKKEVKTLVFISNYFNHHQKPLSDEFYKILGDGYKFIETEPMSEERKKLGWGESEIPAYVISSEKFDSDREKYQSIIDDADVLIFGSAPRLCIENRIKNKKVIFKYSERPIKQKTKKWKYPIRLYTWRKLNPQTDNIKMLCASAYTSADYAKFGLYKNKCYKWGYFTEVKEYSDIDKLISDKKKASILWCARFIDWKHPEKAIEVANRLKADGYNFELNIIGTGLMEDEIRNLIDSYNLNVCVRILGSMKPEEVREYMENSEIFLFTSDRGEGWGAVLNESMNSACAVVASHAIGATPFLLEDKVNGLIYKDDSMDDLYNKVKWLLDNPDKRKMMAKKAYLTMSEEWNAINAAKKFIVLSNAVLNGEKTPELFEKGVCSKAKVLKDGWYK